MTEGATDVAANRDAFDDPDVRAFLESKTPAKRWPEADDLVGVALMFASRAGEYVTGQVLAVDGGWTAT